MRPLVLAVLLVVGCGAEPLVTVSSPVGCWNSLSSFERLDLRQDGTMHHLDAARGATDGTWLLDGDILTIDDAGSLQRWQIVDLSTAEMTTDSGATKHWRSVACQ